VGDSDTPHATATRDLRYAVAAKRTHARSTTSKPEIGPLRRPAFVPTHDHLIYDRERTRKLALWIIAGLIGIVVYFAFIAALVGNHWSEARELLEIVFVPLIGLFGSAVAFYYTSDR
jgi:hypothetical protein